MTYRQSTCRRRRRRTHGSSPKRSSAPGYLSAKSNRRQAHRRCRFTPIPVTPARWPLPIDSSSWGVGMGATSLVEDHPQSVADTGPPFATGNPYTGEGLPTRGNHQPAPTRVAMNRCPLANPSSSQCRLYGRTRRPVLGVAWTAGPPAPRLAAQPAVNGCRQPRATRGTCLHVSGCSPAWLPSP